AGRTVRLAARRTRQAHHLPGGPATDGPRRPPPRRRRGPAPRASEPPRVMTAEPAAATRRTATYPGRVDQLHHVRRAVASHLTGCAAAADAVLIASELAANAILHSRSRAGHFTVRTELHPDHVRIEAEDSGGPWRRRQPDGRPH